MPIVWINIIIIALTALFLILGYQMGAGKVFKSCTSGLIGFIVFVGLAFFLGGILRKYESVQEYITLATDYFSTKWGSMWGDISFGLILFYLAVFVALLIVRNFIIRGFIKRDNSEFALIRLFSRLLGAVSFVAFFAAVILIFFASMHYFEQSQIYSYIIKNIQGTWLEYLYENNPIVL